MALEVFDAVKTVVRDMAMRKWQDGARGYGRRQRDEKRRVGWLRKNRR